MNGSHAEARRRGDSFGGENPLGFSSLLSIIRGVVVVVFLSFLLRASAAPRETLIAEGAEVEEIASGFETVEGPLHDGKGTLFFTDIFRWERTMWWWTGRGVST